MKFTKMQGLGNDYLYVYGPVPENVEQICRTLSNRHFGAGADGMIFMGPSENADFSMRIFNADGSEGAMCGNGVRCVGKYLYEKGYTGKTVLQIETLSGVRTLHLSVRDGIVDEVSVDMGKVVVSEQREVDLCGERMLCTPVSVGNPHAVFFVEDPETLPLTVLGPVAERAVEPGGSVNAEFVRILSPNAIRMRVWERGSGVTLACGTGACAAAAAAVNAGYCLREQPVTVHLDGGDLRVVILQNGHAQMTGPAQTVYEGETALC